MPPFEAMTAGQLSDDLMSLPSDAKVYWRNPDTGELTDLLGLQLVTWPRSGTREVWLTPHRGR